MVARLNASLSWINRDARLITAARGTRTFSQSFVSVIIALSLAELGFNLWQIGAVLTVGGRRGFILCSCGGTNQWKGGSKASSGHLFPFGCCCRASDVLRRNFHSADGDLLLGKPVHRRWRWRREPGSTSGNRHCAGYCVPRKAHRHFAIYSIVARTCTFWGRWPRLSRLFCSRMPLVYRSCRPSKRCS